MKLRSNHTHYKNLVELIHSFTTLGFERLIPLIASYTRFRYVTVLIGIISLYFNYKYNVTVHLGGSQVNNFIDFVISSSDFFVLFVFILYVLARYRLAQLVLFLTALPVLIQFLVQVSVHDMSQGVAVWQWALTLSRIGIYSWICAELVKLTRVPKIQKTALLAGTALLSLFDYYLISDSLIPTLLIIAFISSTTPISNVGWFRPIAPHALGLWFVINTSLSVYHIVSGRSFGLKYLGEPYVQVFGEGIARQIVPFFNEIIMRPYGLTPHPNILGGVSLLGIYLGSFQPFKTMLGDKISSLITICAGLSLYLSMSRNAYVALALVAILVAVHSRKQKAVFSLNRILSVIIALSTGCLVFLTTLNRLGTSDVYRLNDTVRFFHTLATVPLWNYVFGLGLGQYPQYLYNQDVLDTQISLGVWEYQPVHSVPLYLLLSLGVLGALGIAAFALDYRHRSGRFYSDLPLVLYIEWYNSQNEERNHELLAVLKRNVRSGLFHQIVIMHEKGVDLEQLNTLQKKLNKTFTIVTVPRRLTFGEFYTYARQQTVDNPHEEHIMVVANADILFNTSIHNFYAIKSAKPLFVALTRRESNGKKMPDGRRDVGGSFYSHSQDVWMCHSNNRLWAADFTLGTPGCDQRLALFAVTHGYGIVNPYNLIHIDHYHTSQIRSYSRGLGEYKGLRLFPTNVLDCYAVIYE